MGNRNRMTRDLLDYCELQGQSCPEMAHRVEPIKFTTRLIWSTVQVRIDQRYPVLPQVVVSSPSLEECKQHQPDMLQKPPGSTWFNQRSRAIQRL